MISTAQAVIKTSGVTKVYSGKAAVKDVSMTIYKGDIYGFIGSNGAGKTTFIRCPRGLVAFKIYLQIFITIIDLLHN
jgi:ABC-2 type transport system ATP-binding protein